MKTVVRKLLFVFVCLVFLLSPTLVAAMCDENGSILIVIGSDEQPLYEITFYEGDYTMRSIISTQRARQIRLIGQGAADSNIFATVHYTIFFCTLNIAVTGANVRQIDLLVQDAFSPHVRFDRAVRSHTTTPIRVSGLDVTFTVHADGGLRGSRLYIPISGSFTTRPNQ